MFFLILSKKFMKKIKPNHKYVLNYLKNNNKL